MLCVVLYLDSDAMASDLNSTVFQFCRGDVRSSKCWSERQICWCRGGSSSFILLMWAYAKYCGRTVTHYTGRSRLHSRNACCHLFENSLSFLYEGWNFNFGNAAVTFDTAHL